jgi:hypothetical protein
MGSGGVLVSTAIFLSSRGNGGGYRVEICQDHTDLPDGFANLIVEGKWGDQTFYSLGDGDWEQLRDRIDQLLKQR